MKQPIVGIQGSKPRLTPSGNGGLSEEARALDDEYRRQRNETLRLKNGREQMLLGKQRGQLIEKRAVMMQAAYLLSAFRQRVMAEPSSLARRLVDGGFLEEKRRCEVQEMVKNDVYAMLKDLAHLPSQIADPNWIEKIDSDLRAQVDDDEGEDTGGGFVEHPSGLRRQAEQAERRREKKTETMRKLRAEGRIKS
jgi:hypothetical protein